MLGIASLPRRPSRTPSHSRPPRETRTHTGAARTPSNVPSTRGSSSNYWRGCLCILLTYPLLARSCGQPSPTSQEEAAWAFASLSAETEAATALAESFECFALLLDLVRSDCDAVQLQAAWALANLALHSAGQNILLQQSAVLSLVQVLRSSGGNDSLLHQAARCLGTLLTDTSGRQQLLQISDTDVPGGAVGALSAILALTVHASDSVGDAAARAVVHACAQPTSAAALLVSAPGAVEALRDIVLGPPRKRQRTAVTAIFQIACIAAGGSLTPSPTPPRALAQQRLACGGSGSGSGGSGSGSGGDGSGTGGGVATINVVPLMVVVQPLVAILRRYDDETTQLRIAAIFSYLVPAAALPSPSQATLPPPAAAPAPSDAPSRLARLAPLHCIASLT